MEYFKYQTTKRINEIRDNPGCSIWQCDFYEHIIRQYIIYNPLKWELDEENPANEKEGKGNL